jgi:hypothetical protein
VPPARRQNRWRLTRAVTSPPSSVPRKGRFFLPKASRRKRPSKERKHNVSPSDSRRSPYRLRTHGQVDLDVDRLVPGNDGSKLDGVLQTTFRIGPPSGYDSQSCEDHKQATHLAAPFAKAKPPSSSEVSVSRFSGLAQRFHSFDDLAQKDGSELEPFAKRRPYRSAEIKRSPLGLLGTRPSSSCHAVLLGPIDKVSTALRAAAPC